MSGNKRKIANIERKKKVDENDDEKDGMKKNNLNRLRATLNLTINIPLYVMVLVNVFMFRSEYI